MKRPFPSLLCLGDSYTIGEGVPLHDSFPYQLVSKLRTRGMQFQAPEIVAKTGWTSKELIDFLSTCTLLTAYDFVTILTGVNNQYRGLSVHDFQLELEAILQTALQRCLPNHLYILSIPDWGITPFAAERDTLAIHDQIDIFNSVTREVAKQHGVQWLNITEHYRNYGSEVHHLAADNLHPSPLIYHYWSGLLADLIAVQYNPDGQAF